MAIDVHAHYVPKRILEVESHAETCGRHPTRFSWFASGPLPDAAAAARELERSVRESVHVPFIPPAT